MTRKRRESIEAKAQELIEGMCIPIQPEVLAEKLRIEIQKVQLESDVSGILVLKAEKAVMGINKSDSPVRQRFTIAHELGHFVLEHQRGGVFVDQKGNTHPAFYRDAASSLGMVTQEQEANAFAAALLMPKYVVAERFSQKSFDLGDEEALKELAEEFGVSTQAIAFRLANLGLIG